MKVGFAARWSPLDKRSWSGTSYYSYQQIRQYYETEIYHYKWSWGVREWLTTQKSLNRKFFKKQTSVEFLRSYARHFSRQLEKDLRERPVDVLFVSASSQLIAYLETDIPIIYMTDATFLQLQGYYPNFSNLPAYNVRQGITLDKKAFRKTAHCMLASDWNRESAIRDYGMDPGKITVVPCGANLDTIPKTSSLSFESSGQIRLLFLGVEWERKGGELLLEAYQVLRKSGVQPKLHIIGCVPPHDLSADANITIIPFLDKHKEEDLAQLDKIFRQTDLLVLPTRAECAGVVFSESSAYGIPSITTDTGGVTTYVKEGVNGYALPLTATPARYAEMVLRLYRDHEKLKALKKSSRAFYEAGLSWDHWGTAFRAIAEKLVNQRGNWS